jgi:hypothetical protein
MQRVHRLAEASGDVVDARAPARQHGATPRAWRWIGRRGGGGVGVEWSRASGATGATGSITRRRSSDPATYAKQGPCHNFRMSPRSAEGRMFSQVRFTEGVFAARLSSRSAGRNAGAG